MKLKKSKLCGDKTAIPVRSKSLLIIKLYCFIWSVALKEVFIARLCIFSNYKYHAEKSVEWVSLQCIVSPVKQQGGSTREIVCERYLEFKEICIPQQK